MKKYLIKRPLQSNPSVWEWKTYKKEGTTWVGPVQYDTKAQAESAATQWGGNPQVVEIDKPE